MIFCIEKYSEGTKILIYIFPQKPKMKTEMKSNMVYSKKEHIKNRNLGLLLLKGMIDHPLKCDIDIRKYITDIINISHSETICLPAISERNALMVIKEPDLEPA